MKQKNTLLDEVRLFFCNLFFVFAVYFVPRKTDEGKVIIEVLRIYGNTIKRCREARQ